jgi:hypothetical protein
MATEPTISDEVCKAMQEAIAAMDHFQASYALIGGLAASYRSQPRFTKDVDFLVKVQQLALAPLLEDLRSRGFNLDTFATIAEWTEHHMVAFSFHGIRIDWLKPVIPAYIHILEHATEETWLDQRIRIASAEGLILLKLIAFRTQDQLDIENLVAANPGNLDLEWIKAEWNGFADPADPRMKRLLELAKGT